MDERGNANIVVVKGGHDRGGSANQSKKSSKLSLITKFGSIVLLLTAIVVGTYFIIKTRESTSTPYQPDPSTVFAQFYAPTSSSANLTNPNATYQIYRSSVAKDLLANNWFFSNSTDPNGGLSNFLSRKDAINAGILTYNNKSDSMILLASKPSSNSTVPNSLYLISHDVFNGGLFVFDVLHMPSMCGAWPSLFLSGTKWPVGGEIDMYASINASPLYSTNLHTTDGCVVNTNVCSGVSTEANPSDPCRVDINNTLVTNAAVQRGGYLVTLWDKSVTGGVKNWVFDRSSAPLDLINGTPNPTAWPLPVSNYPFTDCSLDHFANISLIMSLTFCGNYAGRSSQWTPACGALGATCENYINAAPSTAFSNAYFEFKSIKTYLLQ